MDEKRLTCIKTTHHETVVRHDGIEYKCTRGIAEIPAGVVESTAGGLRLHPVEVIIEPRGRSEGNGCAGSKRKIETE